MGRKKIKFKNIGLGLLFGLFFFKGLIWINAFPAFQSPDEVGHVNQVYTVKNYHPNLWEKAIIFSGGAPSEVLQKALQHFETDYLRFLPLNHQSFLAENQIASESNKPPPKHVSSYGFGYLPLYYYLNIPATWVSNQIGEQIMVMRVISLVALLLTLLLIYLTGKEIFNSQKWAFLLTVLAGFQPMFNFIMVSVNNDVLLNLVFAFFFYLAVKGFVIKKFNWRLLLIMMLVIGVGVLVKPQAYLLLLLLGVFLVFKILQRKMKFWWLYLTGVFFSGGVLGWFAVQKVLLTRFKIDMAILGEFWEGHSEIWMVKTLVVKRLFTVFYKSFWAQFGWLDTLVTKPYYFLIALFVLVGLAGALIYLVKFLSKLKRLTPRNWMFLYMLIAVGVLEIVYFFLHIRSVVFLGDYNFPTQGRYYFVMLLPILAILLRGWLTVIPKKLQGLSGFLLAFLMIFFNFICLIQFILSRYYI